VARAVNGGSLRALLLASTATWGSCSSGSSKAADPSGSGTITGAGSLASWAKVAASHWIAKPAVGSPPVIAYLFESPVDCSAMTTVGWDLALKGAILELDLWELGPTGPVLTGSGARPLLGESPISAPRTFTIATAGGTATASYLFGQANPDATGGTVTVDALNPSRNVMGSLDVTFPASGGATGPASAKGSFDATWCGAGIEP
jgi:hypothetical protein